jgi:hypothetical protein
MLLVVIKLLPPAQFRFQSSTLARLPRHGQPHAALWASAGGTWNLTDLNTLIDPNGGWTIDVAWAINNRGAIEAVGHKSDLQSHALLLVRCAGQAY